MRLLILQHVSFEGPAAIQSWANMHNHCVKSIDCTQCSKFPSLESFDCLIIMGGPMSVNDELPWMNAELTFIRQCIEADQYVIGICLGAQMIAKTMGAEVISNPFKEIGWLPVSTFLATPIKTAITETNHSLKQTHWSNKVLPSNFTPLHWHGDTFTLPTNATTILQSEGCDNQAFILGQRTLGLQFHLEFDIATATRVANACEKELTEGGPYVQSLDRIIENPERFETANTLLFQLLDALEKNYLSTI